MRDSKEMEKNNVRLWSAEKTQNDKKVSKENVNLQENTDQIADELKQLESEWKSKFTLTNTTKTEQKFQKPMSNPESNEILVVRNDPVQDFKIKNLSLAVTEHFNNSIDIHKKPTELCRLKEIFELKFVKKLEDEIKSEKIIEVNENSLKQLLFVEYIIQRLMNLFTKKTKNFILEKELDDIAKLNQERQREEYLKKCDEYVLKNNILFSDLTNDSEAGALKVNQRVQDQDDNGEAEMLAKLEVFMGKDELKKLSGISSDTSERELIPDDCRKKPLPNYNLLKEEAIKNQLKVSEFFMGATKKIQKEENIEEIDYNRESDVFNQNLIFKLKNTNEEIARILPTVDNQSQIEIRRNIFYEKLVKK
jgi:hypothetical protein